MHENKVKVTRKASFVPSCDGIVFYYKGKLDLNLPGSRSRWGGWTTRWFWSWQVTPPSMRLKWSLNWGRWSHQISSAHLNNRLKTGDMTGQSTARVLAPPIKSKHEVCWSQSREEVGVASWHSLVAAWGWGVGQDLFWESWWETDGVNRSHGVILKSNLDDNTLVQIWAQKNKTQSDPWS